MSTPSSERKIWCCSIGRLEQLFPCIVSVSFKDFVLRLREATKKFLLQLLKIVGSPFRFSYTSYPNDLLEEEEIIYY